jgi:cell division protein FtsW
VLVPGIGVYLNGSRRWIKLPVIPVTIQPGEIGKFILVYYTAHMIAREEIPKRQFFTRTAVPVLAVTGADVRAGHAPAELSTAGCMVLIVGAMLMVGGLTWKQTALLVGLGLAAFFVLAYSEEYRANRMMSFMDPWSYDGAEAYQLVQSLLAVASGGLFGVGLGNSRQKLQFLPYCDSDFIFSIICEELGFVGTTIILLLFLSLIVLGIHVATHARDRFGSMLAMGISTLFAIQVCINVLVVLAGSRQPGCRCRFSAPAERT